MSYLIFARKFRPQNFDDVVGQEPIVRTLKNAIEGGRISQNFLFAGPRGVGKTSTARILAKALNCAKGPALKPCEKCPSCLEITQGNSLDVLEIDGASNRGIDEIRNLRENVKFKPVSGRYKIYIIDEVHQITHDGFNALLKTLEEPPPHVKFVFATTESHKVPLTILSRCQRFNFKRIPTAEIMAKLEAIAKQEKIKYDSKALFLIAQAGDGGLRDAESLLDQLVSFSDGKIKEQDVLLMLGHASEEAYFETLKAVRAKDAKAVFQLVQQLYDDGMDLVQFGKGLFEMFRHLLLLESAEGMEKFIEMSEDGLKQLKTYKKVFTHGELLLALSILNNLQNQLRRNIASPRLLIETTLLKLLHLDGLKALEKWTPDAGPSVFPSGGTVPSRMVPSAPKSSGGWTPPAPAAPAGQTPLPVKAASAAAKPAAVISEGGEVATLGEVEAVWPQVIEYVKSKKMSNGIFLSESEPVEVSGRVITLGFPQEFQFHKEMLEKDASRKLIEEAFEVCLNRKASIQFVITRPSQQELPPTPPAPAEPSAESSKLPEIITEAMNIFEGAKLVRKDP